MQTHTRICIYRKVIFKKIIKGHLLQWSHIQSLCFFPFSAVILFLASSQLVLLFFLSVFLFGRLLSPSIWASCFYWYIFLNFFDCGCGAFSVYYYSLSLTLHSPLPHPP
ncbi:hypothetical protein, unlikely [Trypanosoma brucei gambiense DAL972]|uniref:Uncharacterized protein n=1 Tax=Trypanosoma brucei gambiense (strain MHOM/CI/86/DAL972) TaxID=679716 RepID=C9ZSH1_TRYB9|nr:hypothetical protein, unlikely [Trypanosoma brucei gambiense DAL972]CBH12355.1 hypothetical protein, unlikely [Trypanosoma brucei gambiense DAL972]|eukprot:XP_011774636.1 hypothetical protein, unlikely [Trypanosoma brucei gambiense DAL972]